MATPATPNTAAVHVRGTLDGQQTENTFFYELAAGITQVLLDELVGAIVTEVISEWLPQLPTTWIGREVFAEDLTASSGLQSYATDIFGEPGSLGGTPLPNHVTIALARKSALQGRSFRGRVYWQGLSTASLAASINTISTTFATAVLNAIAAIDNAAIALDWQPVIVSYYSLGTTRATGLTTPIVLWQTTDLTIDSRRRRLPGRGT